MMPIGALALWSMRSIAEDDDRRYTVDNEVLIKAPDGANIAAVVAAPQERSEPLPTLLEFTIEDSQNYGQGMRGARLRGGGGVHPRNCERVPAVSFPMSTTATDARAVIDWIAKQPWSDGRVGMYGDGYSGFTAWAAATRLPPALKAIATSGATAPGIDVPMAGSIFQNSAYRWSLNVTSQRCRG